MNQHPTNVEQGLLPPPFCRVNRVSLPNIFNITALILALGINSPCPAASAYVTDQHSYNLRSGESTRYRIIATLKSGTPVDVISQNEDTGYSHVRLSDDTTGFLRSRYLQTSPTSALQLEQTQKRLNELEKSPDTLALQLSQTQADLATLKQKYQVNLETLGSAEADLAEIRAASADAVRLAQEHSSLQDQVEYFRELTSQLQQLQSEARHDRHHRWMSFGAGLLLFGIIAGIFLQNLLSNRNE